MSIPMADPISSNIDIIISPPYNKSTELKDPPHQARLQRWKDGTKLDDPIQPTQYLPPGKDLQWNLWKTINRMRAGRLKNEDDKCDCGERQTNEHLLICTENPVICTKDDLIEMNQNAIDLATHWLQYNI
ncbi:pleckstriny domain-containing family F member 1 [Aphis craccivora]|uniref:Pleckstriny domain-containing family F member 1 n=1 Tax=Aphis craccivora TaxID=307492 RepID=A0A6G0YV68_APHCR|nr:pleckstriny domain-containing family F member 1 [Aphis craccivora]